MNRLSGRAFGGSLLPALDPLEVHSGVVAGDRRSPADPPGEPLRAADVRGALEELLLPALTRRPCMIAFSGGRDSSALLAVATAVARRHGLDDPVPVTRRFPDHPRTWEAEWQESTVRHLGLESWEILEGRFEFEALGPIAQSALRRHGLHWPGNAHGMNVYLRVARGGALITGNGGDETFMYLVPRTGERASILQIVRMNPWRKLIAYLPLELLPKGRKARILARRAFRLPWLRREPRREVIERYLLSNEEEGENELWNLEKFHKSRYLELARSAFAAYAADYDTLLCEPFFDYRFHRVVVAATPAGGFPSRNAALVHFFGDLLPHEVLRRVSKAVFTEAFWGPESRAFAQGWDGSGLDPHLIIPDALQEEWAKPRPDLRSITPLQAAWLHSQGLPATGGLQH